MRYSDPVIWVRDELGTFYFCLFIFEQLKIDLFLFSFLKGQKLKDLELPEQLLEEGRKCFHPLLPFSPAPRLWLI